MAVVPVLRFPLALLAGTLICTLVAGPASAYNISTARPSTASVGDTVRVRATTALALKGPVAVDLRNAVGKRVRLKANRRTSRTVTVRLRPALSKLVTSPPTRVDLRLVVGGKPGAWRRRALKLTAAGVVVVVPPTPPTPPTPAPEPSPPPNTSKTVVRDADFEYLGAFAMPVEVGCGGWQSYYPSAGLAVRRVDGQLRFLSGAHVYSGGLIYETNYPGLSQTTGSWPEATVVGQPCDIYGGRKRLGADPEPFGFEDETHGLFWDDRTNRLYWSFGHYYNGDRSNDNVLGYSTLGADGAAYGPWRSVDGNVTHSQRVRGGALAIPDAFANTYLGGRSLGIGFGGYYSIIGPGSMGPTLYAINQPSGDGGTFDPMVLIEHPADFSLAQNWAVRPTNYWIDSIDWALGPTADRGYWAPADWIGGAAVWIDEPTKHGLLYFAELGLGRIAYEFGTITTQGTAPYWYIYDPANIAEVALGTRRPDAVIPTEVAPHRYPATGTPQDSKSGAMQRVTGAAYDKTSHTLFVLEINGKQGDWG
ncbi:MAG: hypothetical protein WCI74_12375, partial [Actinomycetes bacterium]